MASDWQAFAFDEAFEVNPKVRLNRGVEYDFVDMKAISPSMPIVGPAERRLFKGGGSRFQSGDTLVARITPCLENGKIAKYRSPSNAPAHGSTEFIVVRGSAGVSCSEYANLVTRSQAFRSFAISQMTGSSGRQRVPTDTLANYQVLLPPLHEQHRIAAALGALDDKIELNRKMNQTLEEMAQAVFKSWFIDFDGHDPTDLVDSELGSIPRGWGVTTVKEAVSELETGSRPKGGVAKYTSGVPSIGAESITGLGEYDYSKTKFIPPDFFATMKRGVLRSRDLLIYKDGGKPGDYRPHVSMFGDGFPFEDASINSHVYRLRASNDLTQEYLYFWFSSAPVMEEMKRRGTGAAIPSLPRTNLYSMPILIPAESRLLDFQDLAESLVGRVLNNSLQSRTLAELRDTLLPKLISGEIRVPEAEEQVEAAL